VILVHKVQKVSLVLKVKLLMVPQALKVNLVERVSQGPQVMMDDPAKMALQEPTVTVLVAIQVTQEPQAYPVLTADLDSMADLVQQVKEVHLVAVLQVLQVLQGLKVLKAKMEPQA